MWIDHFSFTSVPKNGLEIKFEDGEKFTLFGSKKYINSNGAEDIALRWKHTAAHLIEDEVVETGLSFTCDELFESEPVVLYLG